MEALSGRHHRVDVFLGLNLAVQHDWAFVAKRLVDSVGEFTERHATPCVQRRPEVGLCLFRGTTRSDMNGTSES